MFWWIVLAVLTAVLALGWWYDRRRRQRLGFSPGAPESDRAVGEARSQAHLRTIDGLGPGKGP